jgi:hypothetical protein
MLFAIVAYILATNATNRCKYWISDTDITQTINGQAGIGLFSYEGLGSDGQSYCFAYTQQQMQSFWDGPFITGYAFAILANMCLGIALLLLFFVCCFDFGRCMISSIGCLSLFGGLFMALTFVSYASFITKPPFNATFSTASGLAIGTVFAAFITSLLIGSAPPAEPPLEQTGVPAFAPGTVTTTETILPNGSKKIVKTTVNPDGSQTVTETVEQSAV